MTLETLIPQMEFEPAVEEAVTQKITKCRRRIETIAETAYGSGSDDFDFPLCRRKPLTRLVVVTYLLVQKYAEYKAIGAADQVILDTFRDVSLRAGSYYERSGKPGISKDDVIWFRHIMNVHIFKIGALQYQTFHMLYLDEKTVGAPYMVFTEEQKSTLPSGTPVINCHVPKGADMRDASIEDSLTCARAFFKACFPAEQYRAFLCYSWLLYPPMLQRLPEKSNIRRFAGRFKIIGSCGDPAQAGQCLFGDNEHDPRGRLTSLQKAAKAHKEILGYGCGVMTF